MKSDKTIAILTTVGGIMASLAVIYLNSDKNEIAKKTENIGENKLEIKINQKDETIAEKMDRYKLYFSGLINKYVDEKKLTEELNKKINNAISTLVIAIIMDPRLIDDRARLIRLFYNTLRDLGVPMIPNEQLPEPQNPPFQPPPSQQQTFPSHDELVNPPRNTVISGDDLYILQKKSGGVSIEQENEEIKSEKNEETEIRKELVKNIEENIKENEEIEKEETDIDLEEIVGGVDFLSDDEENKEENKEEKGKEEKEHEHDISDTNINEEAMEKLIKKINNKMFGTKKVGGLLAKNDENIILISDIVNDELENILEIYKIFLQKQYIDPGIGNSYNIIYSIGYDYSIYGKKYKLLNILFKKKIINMKDIIDLLIVRINEKIKKKTNIDPRLFMNKKQNTVNSRQRRTYFSNIITGFDGYHRFIDVLQNINIESLQGIFQNEKEFKIIKTYLSLIKTLLEKGNLNNEDNNKFIKFFIDKYYIELLKKFREYVKKRKIEFLSHI